MSRHDGRRALHAFYMLRRCYVSVSGDASAMLMMLAFIMRLRYADADYY